MADERAKRQDPPLESSHRPDLTVVLVRPDSPENVGLAARGMANTGFADLRLVGVPRLGEVAYRRAVHARTILDKARYYDSLTEAVADFHLVLASTVRSRRDFPLVTLDDAWETICEYPSGSRIALVFGNERTGLTAEEISLSNLRFRIPQASRQPSYNLGVAVTLALFEYFRKGPGRPARRRDLPLSREEQEEAGRRFRDLLDNRGFMHETNRSFITERVQDIFRRMVLTAKDRDIILAMFRKALGSGPKKAMERRENVDEGH